MTLENRKSSLPSDLAVSCIQASKKSTETMRFCSYFLANKATVLFDLLGLGFPTFTATVKDIRREFTV